MNYPNPVRSSTPAKGYSLTSFSSVAEIYVLHSKLSMLRPLSPQGAVDHLLDYYRLIWSVDLLLLANQALSTGHSQNAQCLCVMITNVRAKSHHYDEAGKIREPRSLLDLDSLSSEFGLSKPLSYYLQLPENNPEYLRMESKVYAFLETRRSLFTACLESWFL